MSLVRLLTAGKSLVDLKESTSRYQMRGENLLPKFDSPKNPFAARVKPPPAGAMTGATLEAASTELTAAEIAAANLKETKRLPIAAAPPGSPETFSRPVAPAKVSGGIGAWMRKLNPLTWRVNRQPAARTAVPRVNWAPVQGELSLDKVKVVRNDLSEADMEIIPVRNPVRSRARQTTAKAEAAAGGWGS
jgi:hypothetical protein